MTNRNEIKISYWSLKLAHLRRVVVAFQLRIGRVGFDVFPNSGFVYFFRDVYFRQAVGRILLVHRYLNHVAVEHWDLDAGLGVPEMPTPLLVLNCKASRKKYLFTVYSAASFSRRSILVRLFPLALPPPFLYPHHRFSCSCKW